MSPDARLIAAAILLSQERFPKDEHPAPVIGGCANAVLALEVALGDPVKGQPGIRGMVPVGWVNQMLDELFSVAAQVTPQPVPVADKIISIRTQLKQFQEDS